MILFLTIVLLVIFVYVVTKEVGSYAKKLQTPKRKPILLVDMDGVIADYYGHFIRVWKLRHPGRVVVHPDDLKGMYLEDSYPAEYENDIRSINCSAGFFEGIMPIRLAPETINRILDEGKFDVFLCSTPDTGSFNHGCSSEKVRWVELVLGKRWLKRIILTHDKTLVFGDYIIDDKPDIKGVAVPRWKHIVFTHSYNKHLSDNHRLNDWSEWGSLQQTLLAEYNQTN